MSHHRPLLCLECMKKRVRTKLDSLMNKVTRFGRNGHYGQS